MDDSLVKTIKKISITGILLLFCLIIFSTQQYTKGVMCGYVVFCVNIVSLSLIIKTLLQKNKLQDSNKRLAILGFSLKVPLLIGVLYWLIAVAKVHAISIFVGSIIAMLVSGWILFEDYLKALDK